MEFKQTWDLDSLMLGGDFPSGFKLFMDTLDREIGELLNLLEKLGMLTSTTTFIKIISEIQNMKKKVDEANSFVYCEISENIKSEYGKTCEKMLININKSLDTLLNEFESFLSNISDEFWGVIEQEPSLQEIKFTLSEMRLRSKLKLGTTIESLISELSVDGFNAWGELYEETVSEMHFGFFNNGNEKIISIGQAENILYDENRDLRKKIFEEWEEAWEKKSPLIANILNHIAGYRLAMNKYRPYQTLLHESLDKNRLHEKTLHSMWAAIESNTSIFIEYLKRKARLIGVQKLNWYDISAPIFQETTTYTFCQAINLIKEQFHNFNPKMSSFVQLCIDNHWIESEDRFGKRNGAFCLNFPVSKQSRVFMTYSESSNSVYTLAHELGHAYHNYLMRDIPYFNQQYSPIVGETASTFAELLISDAFMKTGLHEKEKMALLDKKIERCITYFMNVRSRFLFEERFYGRRSNGFVSVKDLNIIMEQAQKDAFGNALNLYHPYLWASKMHFYFIQDGPFYNYPYTFGFLFSTGIYAHAIQSGSSFKNIYDDILRDTGRNMVESLANQHLGENLQEKDFWTKAMNLIVNDIREFLDLTEKYI
jgi:oligoendopeptidase F